MNECQEQACQPKLVPNVACQRGVFCVCSLLKNQRYRKNGTHHTATTSRSGDFAPVPRPYARLHGKSRAACLVFYLARAKNRRRALQSGAESQRSFESARPRARRILDDLRGTGARSSALPHTPTCRGLYCRRIVGPVMVRIGFERNESWLKKVLAIAFLSLMDGLEPIHSRRERRVR